MDRWITLILFLMAMSLGLLAFGDATTENTAWLNSAFVMTSLSFMACSVALLGKRLSRIAASTTSRSRKQTTISQTDKYLHEESPEPDTPPSDQPRL